MRTRSPSFAEFSSSCAFTLLVYVTIFPYTGCGTRRSIATTTVFCILSLITRPTRVFRVPRCIVSGDFLIISAIRGTLLVSLTLGEDSLESRDVASDGAEPQRILQRLGRAPESQPETLFLELRHARLDVVRGQLPNLLSSHPSLLP